MEKISSILIALLLTVSGFAQTDSLPSRKSSLLKSLLLPAGLAVTAVAINEPATKQNLQSQILKPFNGFYTTADDYIQYAPIAEMYIASLLKVPAKNNVWGQTKNLFISELATAIVVHSFKRSFNITRPTGDPHSFPSGHTSQAFVTSQVLYQEYKDSNKLIAYSGFLFSIPTGALRVINNQHWLPDVLLGSAIAIAVTNTVYYINPLKNWKLFQKKGTPTSMQVIPIYNGTYAGANFSYRF